MGSANAIAMNEVSKVPDSKGRIPKCFSVKSGVHCVSVKKSKMETSLEKRTVSTDNTRIIPKVTAMVIRALDKSDFSMINSFIFRIKFQL